LVVLEEHTMHAWKILLAATFGAAIAINASAQTTLRIFTGGQQRPDVMRKIADEYQKRNPNVKVEIEVGGATSEAQQQYLSSPEVSKMEAIMASHLPVFPDVYTDPEVLKANPWFADALPVVETAKSRPVSAQYPQVSDAIRSNMNAYLAGTKTTDTALSDMKSRLAPLYR
jgi:ABC-type glycerol-3-phosphate transport system substrate-binding protein